MEIFDSIQSIKGIGEKTAGLFGKAGVFSVSDLLYYYPRNYERFEDPLRVSEAGNRDFATIRCRIRNYLTTRYVKRYQITSGVLEDENGDWIGVTWFNMPYLKNLLLPGKTYIFRGKIKQNGRYKNLEQPKVYKEEEYEKLKTSYQPLYPLVKGLTNHMVQKALKQVFEHDIQVQETLSEDLSKEYRLMNLKQALFSIHFPEDQESLMHARNRLVFEEFYRFILGIREMKEDIDAFPNGFTIRKNREIQVLIEKLPFSLTAGQKQTLEEILEDLSGDHIMNRLVQGDVGSGKTILAFLALYAVVKSGYQGVLMAPTEVLARQHYEKFKTLSKQYDLGLSLVLLTGSLKKKEKEETYEKITTHQADIVIGTHAVLEEKVLFDELALVITDEQHRFGVKHREILSKKGTTPHMMVMSATPIPRTLAMILYGDMDISVIKELPKGRLPIKNAIIDVNSRGKAYHFIEEQVQAGHQCYVICPMVEESELMEGENVIDYAKKLKSILPSEIQVTYLHGRMKNEEKDQKMEAFLQNKMQVLVSTTVIEVGIDVPNATVMLIENAERFGLAQLHQIRGRVGRGDAQSYCIFVNTSGTKESTKRLQVLQNSNDGFFIASEDLKMRGPGDFFGVRQSGEMNFQLGDIYTDAETLKKAEEAANRTYIESRKKKAPIIL